MKFFISGRIDDADAIREDMREIKRAGHELTHDWTATDTFLGSRQSKLSNRAEAGTRASNDIQGVIDCDIYVLSSNNESVGKGMYVELGAALALNMTIGKPAVYIIGEMNHLSAFYLHPSVIHEDTIGDVLQSVE